MKCPAFNAERIGDTVYLEQWGNRIVPIKIAKAMRKSIKKLNRLEARWVYINDAPALLAKGASPAVLTGEFRLAKAKTEKDLNYWKKKLLAALASGMHKALDDILYPEGVPEGLDGLLLKARGFPTGTIRTWSGKEYKKMANGKWVRTYKEEESRGAKQAIRNVRKKIENAKSMGELLEIVKENQSRFQDSKGRMLPIVKEFMAAARATGAGEKKKPEKKKQEETKPLTGEELSRQATMSAINKIASDLGRTSQEIQDLVADYKEKYPRRKITIPKVYDLASEKWPEKEPEEKPKGAEDATPVTDVENDAKEETVEEESKMTGTEKQIKWAEDIKAQQAKKMDHVIEYIKSGKIKAEYVDTILSGIDRLMGDAKFWIDNRYKMDGHSNNWDINHPTYDGSAYRYFLAEIAPKIMPPYKPKD